MKKILSIILISVFIAGCMVVPPPQRSDVVLSDAARALQEAEETNDGNAAPANLSALLQSLEVPPHPRSELTLAELDIADGDTQDEKTTSADEQPIFSAIPPPHPRVDANGQDIAGTDGLVAHEPLQRPTLQPTVDFENPVAESSERGTATDTSRQVAAVTLTPRTTDTPLPTATATTVPPTPTATALPPTAEPTPMPTPAPIVFNVVPQESTITYQVYEQFAYVGGAERLVNGKTQQVEGTLELTLGEPPTLESGYIEVNIASMTSRDPRRDLAIRTGWLESDAYPLARFEVEALQNGPETWSEGESAEFQLLGELTLREITNEVTFNVNATLSDGTIIGSATAEILMTDYGFEPPAIANLVEAANEVTVIVYLNAAAE